MSRLSMMQVTVIVTEGRDAAPVHVSVTEKALVLSDPERVLTTPRAIASFKNALAIALVELNSQIAALPLDRPPR